MSLNSVNTNLGAMVALQSLNRTNEALNATQKRVSTGFRVSDAKDDGAAFAVAQSVRADVAGLTAANEQLGGVKGVLDTSLAGLRKVSDTMIKVRETLVRLADDTLNADQRAQYEAQYGALRTQIQNFIADATYNGRTLLSTDTAAGGGDIVTTRNEAGTTYTLTAVDAAGTLVVAAAPTTAAGAQAAIAAGGDWQTINTGIADALNQYGSDARYVDAQVGYNREKLDALEGGLGALIDADLAKESARLQALQIRQQLGTQSLSIANQAPQSLLSLFRGG
ncbi:flagellin [Roseomonas sp. PWR1]|uniref:Flagellin n=1 Tax=Roseomonas nitratireducens TaxID=2820810 RepID=A0ABS4AQX9_9PROT|nr:flagellin [Neoroseomonas nitratireducens]MBP0463258.1 flagellin [Neoroseomonas nitratireducens]